MSSSLSLFLLWHSWKPHAEDGHMCAQDGWSLKAGPTGIFVLGFACMRNYNVRQLGFRDCLLQQLELVTPILVYFIVYKLNKKEKILHCLEYKLKKQSLNTWKLSQTLSHRSNIRQSILWPCYQDRNKTTVLSCLNTGKM